MRTLAAAAVASVALSTLSGPAVSARPARTAGPGTSPAGSTSQMHTVIVTLKDQADLRGLRGGRKARLRGAVRALHAKADETQRPVRNRLRTRAVQGKVSRTVPLWIVNGVSVTATSDVIQELAARPDVASVESDELHLVPTAAEPNQQAIGAPALWDLGYDGTGVVVANLDTGVDLSHPDLTGRWRGGTNSWFDPYGQHPTTPTDLSGHGTATMGAMVGGSAGGTTIGTAPGASWIAAKIFDDSGKSTATAVHQAFQWVLDPDHDPATSDAPQVVNGSWAIGAGPSCDVSFRPDVQALRAAGILPVFAAGNFGSGTSTSASPANYPESFAVGAVGATQNILSLSSRGPSSCGGRSRVFPDLVAPGSDVRTADRYGLYQQVSGTSMAAPHAAGALAELLSARPDLTADQQQAALTASAHDLGATGPDDVYGAGLLDVPAAYQALPDAPPPPPSPDFAVDLTPAEVAAGPGASATYTVDVTALHGFSGDVTLSLSGLGADEAGWSFTPAVVHGAGTSELTVSTSSTISPGSHPLTVTGSSAALVKAAQATLTTTDPASPPPSSPLFFSTAGAVAPPGVHGAPDDSDVYRWNGSTYARVFDGSLARLPVGADVDGFDRRDRTHFYVSFRHNTRVPGLGVVQDEDVVYYNNGRWRMFFNGTAHGLRSAAEDVDAFSVVRGRLYFSTVGTVRPPGVRGRGDDADIYRWNGRSYARVWDASAHGLTRTADVDGFVRRSATNFFLSFSTGTRVRGLGAVQDEDVVHLRGGRWSLYFDGTAHGLTGAGRDVDALDVP